MTTRAAIFNSKELSLIREYANRYKRVQHGNLNDKKVSNVPSIGFTSGFKFGLGNEAAKGVSNFIFSRNSSNSKTVNFNTYSYGLYVVIGLLTTPIVYTLATFSSLYSVGKEYWFTRKITQLANRKPSNSYELQVTKNLKELLKADKSKRLLRNYKVHIASSLGISTGTACYILGNMNHYSDELTKKFQGFISEEKLSSLNIYLKSLSEKPLSKMKTCLKSLPETFKPSKIEQFITIENVSKFGKTTLALSVGLLGINFAVNLWNDFFEKINNPKYYLEKKASEVESALNFLEGKNFQKITMYNQRLF